MHATHGGAFWKAVDGQVTRLDDIVAADVLDAWFDPAPGVLRALREQLPAISRTSPPADDGDLIRQIAVRRKVGEDSIAVGSGSSSLIFAGLRAWARPGKRAVVLDPTYGEYEHVLKHLAGCDVRRVPLDPERGYTLDLDQLRAATVTAELLVLVNPNSPTGQHVPADWLLPILEEIARKTTVWIDETYVEYAGASQSLEWLAATHPRVIVCKSMSKAYALSGLRVAYMVAHPDRVAEIRRWTPPWAVSLAAQVAAIEALEDSAYYAGRYAQTHELRRELASALEAFEGVKVTEGVINCLMAQLSPHGPNARELVRSCAGRGVFLRDTATMGTTMGDRTVRIAVRDRESNLRVIRTLGECLHPTLARLR